MTPEAKRPRSAAELLDLVTLSDVRFIEVSGRRWMPDEDGDAPSESTTLYKVMQQTNGELGLGVRCQLDAQTPDAVYRVDAEVRYLFLDPPVEVEDAVAKEFVERVALMALMPFIREALHGMSAKIDAGRLLLGIIPAGGIKLNDESPAEDTAESAPVLSQSSTH